MDERDKVAVAVEEERAFWVKLSNELVDKLEAAESALARAREEQDAMGMTICRDCPRAALTPEPEGDAG